VVTWKTFATAAPELAEAGRSQLFQFRVGLAFLATVRKDGAPRVHPVCPVLSDDRLFVLVTPASPKRHDLLRDGRYSLQALPQPKAGSDEFYLAGKAALIDDAATRVTVLTDARHMADESETLFELLIDRAMRTTWQHVLTRQMRSAHQIWHAPTRVGGASSG
jgi:Pyridoxamine 5'-phosphate oxidase